MIKKILAILFVLGYLTLLGYLYFDVNSDAVYPNKPVTIVVHSKPGSAIDLMSRKVAEIAKKYSKEPFVVENRPGTQGIVAMQHVIDRKADGYILLGVTRSFLSTLIVNKSDVSISDFDFLAKMISDPEAIISNKKRGFNGIKDVIVDAKKHKQVWIGPGTGSRDHLMAIKTWKKLGIKAEWVDYKSGPQAILAMMRDEAPIYVGNPADISGKKDLKIIAIAAETRHKGLPEVETFKENGIDLVESMWRGYAFKKGTPAKAVKYMSDVLSKVAEDPEWKDYCESVFAFSDYLPPKEFSREVELESKETKELLKSAGLLNSYFKKGVLPLWAVAILLALAIVLLLLVIFKFDWRKLNFNILFASFFIWVAAFFYYQTMLFNIPEGLNITNPALIPRIWSIALLVFAVWNIYNELNGKNKPYKPGNIKLVSKVLFALLMYYIAIPFVGYFVSTPVFLLATMYILKYRNWTIMLINAFGFVLFSYLVFELLLKIDLPLGNLLI